MGACSGDQEDGADWYRVKEVHRVQCLWFLGNDVVALCGSGSTAPETRSRSVAIWTSRCRNSIHHRQKEGIDLWMRQNTCRYVWMIARFLVYCAVDQSSKSASSFWNETSASCRMCSSGNSVSFQTREMITCTGLSSSSKT